MIKLFWRWRKKMMKKKKIDKKIGRERSCKAPSLKYQEMLAGASGNVVLSHVNNGI
ncbi:hypothetical protein DsansV1_C31g0216481 [Dioscorea sansibarensis]